MLVVPLLVNSVAQAPVQWPGGLCVLSGVATAWNGATATVVFLGPDGATYLTTPLALSANGISATPFALPQGLVKIAVTGGTPTSGNINLMATPTNLN